MNILSLWSILKSKMDEFNVKVNYVLDKAIESKYRWFYLFLFFLNFWIFEFLNFCIYSLYISNDCLNAHNYFVLIVSTDL